MDPKEYFSEMSPIFCTSDIPPEVIGDHMTTFLLNRNIPAVTRKLLVGGMAAEKILLASPLLKWYMEHGIMVTRIYQAVEYQPKEAFKSFHDDVSSARRDGDADPSKAIIADTSKLVGMSFNFYYTIYKCK